MTGQIISLSFIGTTKERTTTLDANLSNDQLQLITNLIEEALKPIREDLNGLEKEINRCAHDEYASADHVERSENSFNSQFYQIKNDISNLEYRISDVQRTAERAQSAAVSAQRNSSYGRGGNYY
jgi:predicted  nucleic acid-binding Zn-ribbon protein